MEVGWLCVLCSYLTGGLLFMTVFFGQKIEHVHRRQKSGRFLKFANFTVILYVSVSGESVSGDLLSTTNTDPAARGLNSLNAYGRLWSGCASLHSSWYRFPKICCGQVTGFVQMRHIFETAALFIALDYDNEHPADATFTPIHLALSLHFVGFQPFPLFKKQYLCAVNLFIWLK